MAKKLISNEQLLKEIQNLKKELQDIKKNTHIQVIPQPYVVPQYIPHNYSPCLRPHYQPYHYPYQPFQPWYSSNTITTPNNNLLAGSLNAIGGKLG